MPKPPDDLEAVRILVETLKPFEVNEQERIIRWTIEKIGLSVSSQVLSGQQITAKQQITGEQSSSGIITKKAVDIKTFVSQKNPSSINQFATTVAYYYRFEAPEDQRKDTITSEDLQEACRQVGRSRLLTPAQNLLNAHLAGLLDKGSERGNYSINTVGENLVAMTLPISPKSTKIKKTKKTTKSPKIKKQTSKGKRGKKKRK